MLSMDPIIGRRMSKALHLEPQVKLGMFKGLIPAVEMNMFLGQWIAGS